MNKGVYIALISIGLAQALKIPIHFFKTRKWKPKFILSNGWNAELTLGRSILFKYIYCPS